MRNRVCPGISRYEQEPVKLRISHDSIETVGGLSKYATCLGFGTIDKLTFFLDDGRRPTWKEDLLKEMEIPYFPIRPDIFGDPYGVIIYR